MYRPSRSFSSASSIFRLIFLHWNAYVTLQQNDFIRFIVAILKIDQYSYITLLFARRQLVRVRITCIRNTHSFAFANAFAQHSTVQYSTK